MVKLNATLIVIGLGTFLIASILTEAISVKAVRVSHVSGRALLDNQCSGPDCGGSKPKLDRTSPFLTDDDHDDGTIEVVKGSSPMDKLIDPVFPQTARDSEVIVIGH